MRARRARRWSPAVPSRAPNGWRVLASLLGLALACPLGCASAPLEAVDSGVEVLDLRPARPSDWSFRHLGAPFVALLRGPDYVYAPRRIHIETTPSGGYLDLFYVRSGFQKRFEQAESPVVVILPSRLDAGPRDSFTVRAFAEGYRQESVTHKLSERFEEIALDLSPLPNRLDAVSHRYFAGRSSVAFLTPVALTFRVQEADDGIAVILNETALAPDAREAVEAIRSPLIAEGYGQQLGEDLMIKLVLSDSAARESIEVRSRQRYDAPRDHYEFALDLVPADSAAQSVEQALDALAALQPGDVTGCALAFDDTLRGGLDPGALARALRPRGAFTDRYLRAAMRRLGEVSVDGVVDFTDGTRLRPSSAIELEMAVSNAATARGYLALLRSFVGRLEADPAHRDSALKSLVAPELAASRFEAALEDARRSEGACAGP